MEYHSISNAKNNLSSIIGRVREGTTIIITDRGTPVARLEPIRTASDNVRVNNLIDRGLVRGPVRPPAAALPSPVPLPSGVSILEGLLQDREEGR